MFASAVAMAMRTLPAFVQLPMRSLGLDNWKIVSAVPPPFLLYVLSLHRCGEQELICAGACCVFGEMPQCTTVLVLLCVRVLVVVSHLLLAIADTRLFSIMLLATCSYHGCSLDRVFLLT